MQRRHAPGGISDEQIIHAIACGRAWFEELASGRASSFGEIATRVGVTDRYVSRIVDLASLAPDFVEGTLADRLGADVTVKSLTVQGSVPSAWKEQPRTFGIGVPRSAGFRAVLSLHVQNMRPTKGQPCCTF